MSEFIQPRLARAYIGPLPRLPRERQLALCEKAVDAIDGVPALDRIYEPDEFEVFIRDFRRADQVAVVARLMAFAEKSPKGKDGPGSTFFLRVMRLRDAALYIVDAETGIRSIDGDAWYDLVATTARKITRGRPLTPERAKKLAKKSREDRLPGLVDEWQSPARAKERERVGQHWRDPRIKSAEEAIASVPEEFAELRTVSRSTMERIFGGRTVRSKRRT